MEALKAMLHEDLLKSEFKSLSIVKVYLLISGRNSWHGTWSTQYRRNRAIFGQFREATSVAENLRIQGTQFTIKEIPALAFASLSGVIVVTEFHSNPSFKNLKMTEISENLVLNQKLVLVTSPFRTARNEYWNTPFPSPDSFIVGVSQLSDTLEEYPERNYLKVWKSSSIGPNYYLDWQEVGKQEKLPIEEILAIYKLKNKIENIINCEFELELKRKELVEKVARENRTIAAGEQLMGFIDDWFEQNGIEKPPQNEADNE